MYWIFSTPGGCAGAGGGGRREQLVGEGAGGASGTPTAALSLLLLLLYLLLLPRFAVDCLGFSFSLSTDRSINQRRSGNQYSDKGINTRSPLSAGWRLEP